MLGLSTFAAAIFALSQTVSENAAVFAVMVPVCLAMTGDIGVRQAHGSTAWTSALRLLQVLAGITGLAHVARVTFHDWLA